MKNSRITIDELRQICVSALMKKGATPEEAGIVFEDYLDAELRGRRSHGFSSFGVAVGAFPHTGHFEIVSETAGAVVVDGHGDCGHVVARRAVELALRDLDQRGSRTVGIRNITRFNCPGCIARYAAERGAVAIVLEYGGQNFMAPHGGKRAVLSTNPIGIAVPGTDPLFVVDIAVSERAVGFVGLAKQAGESIPPTWGIDGDGRATTDPAALAAVSSFGGYKGYALGLAFEILAGALVGVPIGSKGTLGRRGALIQLISPSAFGRVPSDFFGEVREFLAEVISSEPVDVQTPVLYPGLAGQARSDQSRGDGSIELPSQLIDQLRSYSA